MFQKPKKQKKTLIGINSLAVKILKLTPKKMFMMSLKK